MGAEAWIGLSKVLEGHEHLGDISAYNANQLRPIVVKDPLAFIPIYISIYGDVECALAGLKYMDGESFHLVNFCDIIKLCPHIAVGTIGRSYPNFSKMIEKSCPGSVNQNEMISAWDKITPGIWVITSYDEYGTLQDCYFKGEYPGLRLDKEISWEFWT